MDQPRKIAKPARGQPYREKRSGVLVDASVVSKYALLFAFVYIQLSYGCMYIRARSMSIFPNK